jgi:hypothetical protein
MSTTTKFQSFNWLRGIADDTRISIVHRLVLMRLCLHRRNDSGKCDPGYDIVAKELGVHRASVFRAIDVGIRFGYLTPPIRRGPAKVDLTLTFPNEVAPELPLEVAAVRPQEANEVAPVHKRGRTAAQMRSQRQRASEEKSNTSTRNGRSNGRREREKETLSPPDVASRDEKKGRRDEVSPRAKARAVPAESFERFWRIYPRKVAKEGARRAFEKALKAGADADVLIAGAQRYAIERQEQDPKYTKHPATWLNAGCWEDELPGAVIDEEGNVVAVDPPTPERGRDRGIVAVAEELEAERKALYGDGLSPGWDYHWLPEHKRPHWVRERQQRGRRQ